MSLCCICEKYKGRNSFHAVKLKQLVHLVQLFVVVCFFFFFFFGGGGLKPY